MVIYMYMCIDLANVHVYTCMWLANVHVYTCMWLARQEIKYHKIYTNHEN